MKSLTSNRSDVVASVVSEILGPPLLITILVVQVAVRFGVPPMQAIVAILSLAVAPYVLTIALSRMGKVTDRYVANRKHRPIILLLMLVIVVAGLVALALMGATAPMLGLSAMAATALIVVAIISAFWKISVHATIAAFFVGVQVILYGYAGLISIVVVPVVYWARLHLKLHTHAQLLGGVLLGVMLAGGYSLILS